MLVPPSPNLSMLYISTKVLTDQYYHKKHNRYIKLSSHIHGPIPILSTPPWWKLENHTPAHQIPLTLTLPLSAQTTTSHFVPSKTTTHRFDSRNHMLVDLGFSLLTMEVTMLLVMSFMAPVLYSASTRVLLLYLVGAFSTWWPETLSLLHKERTILTCHVYTFFIG